MYEILYSELFEHLNVQSCGLVDKVCCRHLVCCSAHCMFYWWAVKVLDDSQGVSEFGI